MEKPKKPIEPKIENYDTPKEPNGKNYLGQPLFQKLDWVRDYENYKIELNKYEANIKLYEQIKLIKLIKNSTEKYCLKKLNITYKNK